MANFRADLKYGQCGEAFVASLGKDTSIEVKRDRLCLSTGNIFIELECNGTTSGIMATDASYLVHLIPKGDRHVGGLLLDVKPLKNIISSLINDGIAKTKDWSGDKGRVKGIIISLDNIGELIRRMANAPQTA